MKTERKYISGFGAVRMTRAEAIEMITDNVRYQNFWIHVTAFEEDEDRGGNVQRMGYLLYRDYGNEPYGQFLSKITKEGYENGK
eukprot:9497806-Heterocapsa_arctica.AAC.1